MRYITMDGKEFTSLTDAEKHEAKLIEEEKERKLKEEESRKLKEKKLAELDAAYSKALAAWNKYNKLYSEYCKEYGLSFTFEDVFKI